MPRYYFHLRDGSEHLDREGAFLPNTEAARTQAAVYLGEILRNGCDSIWNGEDWRLNVVDESGLVLFVIHIVAVEAAAAKNVRSMPRPHAP